MVVVLDQGSDTATAIRRTFFQIPGYYRRIRARPSVRTGPRPWPPLTLADALAGKHEVAVREGI